MPGPEHSLLGIKDFSCDEEQFPNTLTGPKETALLNAVHVTLLGAMNVSSLSTRKTH